MAYVAGYQTGASTGWRAGSSPYSKPRDSPNHTFKQRLSGRQRTSLGPDEKEQEEALRERFSKLEEYNMFSKQEVKLDKTMLL